MQAATQSAECESSSWTPGTKLAQGKITVKEYEIGFEKGTPKVSQRPENELLLYISHNST